MLLTFLGVVIFEVSHMLGASVSDPALSRDILMWNLSVIFISIANFHCVISALGKNKEKRSLVITIYALGAAFIIYYLIFPNAFLLQSVPKMYFPNYYVPGYFYWVSRLVFQGIIPVYFIYLLIDTYRKTSNYIERNRLIYFAVALAFGWSLGAIPPLLIFNIQVDPVYGLAFPIFFGLPFMYAVLHYELMDIKIIAKKAFVYGIAVTGIGSLLISFNLSSQLIQEIYPDFPFWVIPIISAIIAVALGILVWRQLRQGDVLKYEFITTATHKFRTPLTHIKWASENLEKPLSAEEHRTALEYIKNANSKLVELTDVLMNISSTDDVSFDYRLEKINLSETVEGLYQEHLDQASIKKISLNKNIGKEIFVSCDESRLKFVMQTLVENALSYTHDGGAVIVSLIPRAKDVIFSVKDSGIGIAHKDLPYIFTKFYRGSQARLADTEGMGIGLYISKQIINRHHGKIWVESDGAAHGSTFLFSLPASNHK